MKPISMFLILSLIFLSEGRAKAKNSFEKILSTSSVPENQVGAYILKDKEIIFQNRAEQKMTPASLSKLLTAIAALNAFAPDDRMQTDLLSSAEIKNNFLGGELCIKGNGDPSFISEQMWVLVNNLTRTGVTKIKGPLWIDSSIFDTEYFDESREKNRVDRAYDSPVSGLPFNWNTVNVYIRPTHSETQITVDPESDYFNVINKVKVVSGKKVDLIINKKKTERGESLVVSGTIGARVPEVVKYASVTYPDLWVGRNLISFLRQRGITIENMDVQSKKCLDKMNVLASSKGWTYQQILDGMLKFSNNFLAESVTKNISVKYGSKPGSILGGIKEIKQILQSKYRFSPNEYTFISPSGFSTQNKISAQKMTELLSSAYKDFNVSSYLLSELATPQGEGTLSKRIKDLESSRWIRAKTGLLSGVVGLAGYAANSKGEVYSFAFMYNGSGKEERARELFDRLAFEITKL